ncbi:hypothetical protein H4R33_004646 [Dimargaris cristalligena]|uniref:Uncharacterized protein n=1 Tax=Dimargaris cristalligena TaxID=215637 RepID=A0A4P9ZVY9_9FUNG|nr:hypothetical protein H4R33_004646 [Dimargaris cristalligena]RKP37767.1 hypothetical protein BJ085DRAFT_41566 [Dimargaris cristalligena]|eukprot:RKP37767.1 hypothetical protein BJ085DRAFT_41566 [Dimargaris cristalligena]
MRVRLSLLLLSLINVGSTVLAEPINSDGDTSSTSQNDGKRSLTSTPNITHQDRFSLIMLLAKPHITPDLSYALQTVNRKLYSQHSALAAQCRSNYLCLLRVAVNRGGLVDPSIETILNNLISQVTLLQIFAALDTEIKTWLYSYITPAILGNGGQTGQLNVVSDTVQHALPIPQLPTEIRPVPYLQLNQWADEFPLVNAIKAGPATARFIVTLFEQLVRLVITSRLDQTETTSSLVELIQEGADGAGSSTWDHFRLFNYVQKNTPGFFSDPVILFRRLVMEVFRELFYIAYREKQWDTLQRLLTTIHRHHSVFGRFQTYYHGVLLVAQFAEPGRMAFMEGQLRYMTASDRLTLVTCARHLNLVEAAEFLTDGLCANRSVLSMGLCMLLDPNTSGEGTVHPNLCNGLLDLPERFLVTHRLDDYFQFRVVPDQPYPERLYSEGVDVRHSLPGLTKDSGTSNQRWLAVKKWIKKRASHDQFNQ